MSWCLHFGDCPPEPNPARCNPLAAQGLRYEARVLRELGQTDLKLERKPWLRNHNGRLCQPDGVILFEQASTAIVVEVKLNWAQRRDGKLKQLYLPAVQSAFALQHVYPLMVVSCIRRLGRSPSRNFLEAMKAALIWTPAMPTPVLLLP